MLCPPSTAIWSSTPTSHTWVSTFLNISAPLRASRRAISCGVVTMATPVEVRQEALCIRNYQQTVTSYSLQSHDIHIPWRMLQGFLIQYVYISCCLFKYLGHIGRCPVSQPCNSHHAGHMWVTCESHAGHMWVTCRSHVSCVLGSTRDGYLLREGKLGISCSWGHVHH